MNAFLSLLIVATGCERPAGQSGAQPSGEEIATGPACAQSTLQELVQTFGQRLRMVSVLAPDSIVATDAREHYGSLVTPRLLEHWVDSPDDVPGREVSSPWPERIEIVATQSAGAERCRVEGEIIYVTGPGNDTGSDTEVERAPVVLEIVSMPEGRRIDAVERPDAGASAEPDSVPSTDVHAAAAVLRQYYAAIEADDYRRAYTLWSGDGEASGKTYEAFARGYAETADVEVEIGATDRIEGAAGSRYVTIPVRIDARTSTGERQRFSGTYTLRRSVVDGATAEQREWRIYSASISSGSREGGGRSPG